jgi:hypothetical protein
VAPVTLVTLGLRALAGGLLTAGVLAIVAKVGTGRRVARQKSRKV